MSGRRPVRSASHHDRLSEAGERSSSSSTTTPIPRPGSHSKLLNTLGGTAGAGSGHASPRSPESKQRLTKLLLNVTVLRSLGPVHVIVSPESTVVDLIKAAVEAYVREGRRPLLTERDPLAYDLHYSQFSLESLDAAEKLGNLGSRNFFLCPKPQNGADTCSNQAEKAAKSVTLSWRFALARASVHAKWNLSAAATAKKHELDAHRSLIHEEQGFESLDTFFHGREWVLGQGKFMIS
ncbi:hypothetical protein H6P81_016715 [Aristolochia fimbriata]|uniref:DUF7054 domain-containing protein n=1 Tax=Aristolochia fimbriata TaxID=158543 RepID=A0AAV7EB80_ARIFI|nr:hypothetical protein H6P81_016715 [Aristolochia fimbriata]